MNLMGLGTVAVALISSLPACDSFYQLLITFTNSLDLNQAYENVWPDLDPNCFHSDDIPARFFQNKSLIEKKIRCNITQHAKS